MADPKEPSRDGSLDSAESSAEKEKLKAEMEAVEQALLEAKTKSEENWSLFLRARADLDNIRKRAETDVRNAHKYALDSFIRELLVVIDSLEQGLQAAESAHDAVYREGMALTLKLMLDTFEKFGVTQINPEGEMFDPNRMEAVSMQVQPNLAPNKVIAVAQKGFMLQDRILRPARVVVSKAA